MDYNFREIEAKWQQFWAKNNTYKTEIDRSKPKYYVLDMFPYPSGAGLHVGHPLGYIASDIFSRYKKHKGFNVLHPMGFDAFGLPAEQYAIQTGQHPNDTTEKNISRYREQLDRLGFSFDWSRELRTSDPSFFKWTQWIFMQLFNAWYNTGANKAEKIEGLIKIFEADGNIGVQALCNEVETFAADAWKSFGEKKQQEILLQYRMAYISESWVNWCAGLGTVLANEEVKDGFSERGGFPVERKLMKQWSLRITAYAERLLQGLETIDWPEPLKEMQRNWIGRSKGASLRFKLKDYDKYIEVFTTRPDTIFGVTFMTLAPEHELVNEITTPEYRAAVEAYVTKAGNRSERERIADVKTISGQFTGAYVINPFSKAEIPVWVGDYVLAGYGTGAVMAVPGHDSRDYAFATHFKLPITEVVKGGDLSVAAHEEKTGTMVNSGFMDGMEVLPAIEACINEIEKAGLGVGKTNYRLRDAIFSRQRYWGEPFPVYYKDGLPYLLPEGELPLRLPQVDAYLPTESGEPPLARAANWHTKENQPLETSTMPGWAGSSWYYLRYMDAQNDNTFVSKEAADYWQEVDLYLGGAEHATGHLLYVRFWTKFLNDLGHISIDEPAKKLINQGMIQGVSALAHRVNAEKKYVSAGLAKDYDTTLIHADVALVKDDVLDVEKFKKWKPEAATFEFVTENGIFLCVREVEKMSKSKYNVVSPDDIIDQYGTDTLRMYEMFLGPLELSKPWSTQGIEGVHKFLRKLWRLVHNNHDDVSIINLTNDEPSNEELKTLHKTIQKIQEDIERFSFNTCISTFMICVNELTDLKCNKRAIIEPLAILLSPFAPHAAEELWQEMGHDTSINTAPFPVASEKYLVDDTIEYPVSVNGKTRFKIKLDAKMGKAEIEKAVMNSEEIQKHTNGNSPKKIIVVHGRIVNIVI